MQLIAVEVNHDVGNSKCLHIAFLTMVLEHIAQIHHTHICMNMFILFQLSFKNVAKYMQNYAGDQANLEKAGLKASSI